MVCCSTSPAWRQLHEAAAIIWFGTLYGSNCGWHSFTLIMPLLFNFDNTTLRDIGSWFRICTHSYDTLILSLSMSHSRVWSTSFRSLLVVFSLISFWGFVSVHFSFSWSLQTTETKHKCISCVFIFNFSSFCEHSMGWSLSLSFNQNNFGSDFYSEMSAAPMSLTLFLILCTLCAVYSTPPNNKQESRIFTFLRPKTDVSLELAWLSLCM